MGDFAAGVEGGKRRAVLGDAAARFGQLRRRLAAVAQLARRDARLQGGFRFRGIADLQSQRGIHAVVVGRARRVRCEAQAIHVQRIDVLDALRRERHVNQLPPFVRIVKLVTIVSRVFRASASFFCLTWLPNTISRRPGSEPCRPASPRSP